MPHICLECYEVYNDEMMIKTKYDYNTEMFCPKKSCQGNVVEIDELFLLPIIILNSKGYLTKYCCSGHVFDDMPNSYIYFEDEIELPSLPKGFNKDNNSNCIRKFYENYKNDIALQKELLKSSIDVLTWANKLEELY